MTITSCEHTCATLLSTCPQSTGGDNESGEPDDPGPATLGSTAPEDWDHIARGCAPEHDGHRTAQRQV
jgi:hypothetical protein